MLFLLVVSSSLGSPPGLTLSISQQDSRKAIRWWLAGSRVPEINQSLGPADRSAWSESSPPSTSQQESTQPLHPGQCLARVATYQLGWCVASIPSSGLIPDGAPTDRP
ncbi:uncharacterized protein BO80DRAFT_137544 [Aspergillus ibericus CBS 121593]|uniref:Uncharacterized protein n=1 Tax=Aspergillus ibericus CBS 121593 TaxID=1448316 RepID=A0A395HC05_9EURO|nr:hypothetical protein BO80DRAFT_137544 [Aspergillus ibericus CBS 121593]RAL05481.1 hypothetical protein BO80DRAFT_137544 [Aspergillus ibericus CBS 121593]